MQALKELFPEFVWAEGADNFLEELRSKRPTLIEQLQRRKIARTEVAPLLFPGGCKTENGKFIIIFNEQTTLGERIETLGHEIGHTFHYDLTSVELHLLCPEAIESEDAFGRVEEFCTIFANRWLEYNPIGPIPEIVIV